MVSRFDRKAVVDLLFLRGRGYLPDSSTNRDMVGEHLSETFFRLEMCFSAVKRKYYSVGDEVRFDPFHGDHMASFLWFLSNTIYSRSGETLLPSALSYLNRVSHSVDLFYNVQMPEVFLLVHPLGSVIGRATYSKGLVIYQNVTVGAIDDSYPRLGEWVILYPGSRVIGNASIGSNCVIAPGTQVVNEHVPDNTLVFGLSPWLVMKPNRIPVSSRAFGW